MPVDERSTVAFIFNRGGFDSNCPSPETIAYPAIFTLFKATSPLTIPVEFTIRLLTPQLPPLLGKINVPDISRLPLLYKTEPLIVNPSTWIFEALKAIAKPPFPSVWNSAPIVPFPRPGITTSAPPDNGENCKCAFVNVRLPI